MYPDRFDFIEAYYAFCCDWHGGQASELYSKLCRIKKYYRPGAMFNGYDSLTENGKEYYHQLEEKYC